MIQLKTKNQNLVNTTSNGVPYIKKCFTLYGIQVCGVFPVFEGIKVTLDGTVDSLYKELGNTDYSFYHGTMRLATKMHTACSHTGGSYTWNRKHLV